MKVIIVGAGVSGLTLAAAVAELAPQHDVELYERDASAAGRRKARRLGSRARKGWPFSSDSGCEMRCSPVARSR